MKFSIISCTRNNSKWIKTHIDSVKKQTYKNYEHIIIDDASTDDSVSVIKHNLDEKIRLFVRKERTFAIRNHILGLKQISGDIVVHLDGDDWFYDENALSIVFETYKKTSCWATYGSWVSKSDSTKKSECYDLKKLKDSYDCRKNAGWQFTHLRTFRKELISSIVAFDLFNFEGNLHNFAPDVALCMGPFEYALKKNKVEHIKNTLVVYNDDTGLNEHSVDLTAQSLAALQIYNSNYSIIRLPQ